MIIWVFPYGNISQKIYKSWILISDLSIVVVISFFGRTDERTSEGFPRGPRETKNILACFLSPVLQRNAVTAKHLLISYLSAAAAFLLVCLLQSSKTLKEILTIITSRQRQWVCAVTREISWTWWSSPTSSWGRASALDRFRWSNSTQQPRKMRIRS